MNQPVQMSSVAEPDGPAMAMGSPGAKADPLRAISRLGDRAARDGIYLGLIIALLSHTAAIAFPDFTTWAMAKVADNMREQLHQYFWQEYDIVVDQPPPQPEKQEADEPEPEDVAEPEPPEPEPAALPPPTDEPDEPTPPDNPYADDDDPPPPSEAPDVLTNDAVDLTGEGFVDKDGSTANGAGMVSVKGNGREVVRNPHAKTRHEGDKRNKGGDHKRRRRGPPAPESAVAVSAAATARAARSHRRRICIR